MDLGITKKGVRVRRKVDGLGITKKGVRQADGLGGVKREGKERDYGYDRESRNETGWEEKER